MASKGGMPMKGGGMGGSSSTACGQGKEAGPPIKSTTKKK